MTEEGSQIASVPVTLKVTEVLRVTFCCPNAIGVFSRNLTEKHKSADQHPFQHEISQEYGY